MGALGAQRLDTLVGRAGELAELERGLDRAASGDPWFVQVVWEPGIGKTRLLAELGLRAEERGWLVLDGRAAEFERDVPFGLMVDALNDYLAGLEPALLRSLEDDELAELASIFEALSRYADEVTVRGGEAQALLDPALDRATRRISSSITSRTCSGPTRAATRERCGAARLGRGSLSRSRHS
jgi:predicted ATPase